MTTFTIDAENSITAFPTLDQAEPTIGAGAQSFASQKELAELAAAWPTGRLVEVWNGFAGVAPFGDLKPVKKFTDRKTAVTRIWQAIQKLDEEVMRTSIRDAEAKLKDAQQHNAPAAQQAAQGAPAKRKARKKATAAKNAPKAKKAAKSAKSTKPLKAESGPREGTKTAQVVAMLQRKNGATLAEIMDKMGWQKHTVRGFIAGAMKKAGFSVESFKPEGGERCDAPRPCGKADAPWSAR